MLPSVVQYCFPPLSQLLLAPCTLLFLLCSSMLGLRDDVYKYGVGTIKLYHGIALVLLVMFLVQLITGFLLVSLISLQLELAYTHLYFVLTSN